MVGVAWLLVRDAIGIASLRLTPVATPRQRGLRECRVADSRDGSGVFRFSWDAIGIASLRLTL